RLLPHVLHSCVHNQACENMRPTHPCAHSLRKTFGTVPDAPTRSPVNTPTSPVLVAAGALAHDLQRPSRVLAARRSAPKSLAGRWEFAGGKVEPDETPEQAVHRELWEELGIRIELGAEVVTNETDGGGSWPILNDLTMRIWFARI